MQSNQTTVWRHLPIVAGILGSLLLIVNRLFTPELTDSQARSDVLGVILSGVLVLSGLLWQQYTPRSPEAVELIGQQGLELAPELPETLKNELAWASHLLLTNTVTRSVVVWYQGQTILRRGVLGEKDRVTPGAIVERVLKTQKPVYLVDLKVYPGRIEFDYLPENTQGAICQPLGNKGVLILGAYAPRSYTKQDEAWIEGIADKLADTLDRSQLSVS
ncbi:cofactor assembly of complex C subunit B [Merismopedia glauca]|uniref:Cofactor assembly of complex C subunit B n=1 Tax=Merismopedia glauca CCAP 1448/3 TaxID=1296344 RepID=A0A2T1C0K6_9CYAN|nr:cofactor assembly of complex C subunit B [Merismopedia glauca]PSB01815.1 cofactor assembly of complex C subunit B [Merismopedia glauca CCAP 1448/3]